MVYPQYWSPITYIFLFTYLGIYTHIITRISSRLDCAREGYGYMGEG